LQNALEDGE
jgi:hypothetical protein